MSKLIVGGASAAKIRAVIDAARIETSFRPHTSLPSVAVALPTIGTPADVTGNTTTDVALSSLTNPIAVPYYVNGVAANGENLERFSSYGWSRQPAGAGAGLAMGRATPPHGLGNGGYPSSVEFVHDGPSLELRLYTFSGAGVQFQLYINDRPIATSVVTVAGTAIVGHSYLVPITFTTTEPRRIRVEFDRARAFGGVVVNGSDFIGAAPSALPRPQLLLVGDSYSDGAAGVHSLDTYAMKLGKLLNMDTWVDGQGGSGFVANAGGGTKGRYIERIVPNGTEPRLRPDVIVLQTSTNDGVSAPIATDVATRVPEAIAACRSQWPTAKILMPGLMLMLQSSSIPSTNVLNNALARGAASAADLFVDPFPGLTVAGQNVSGWYTGSGNVVTPGTGNSGRYRSEDNIHGVAAWHDMAAYALASRFTGYLAK